METVDVEVLAPLNAGAARDQLADRGKGNASHSSSSGRAAADEENVVVVEDEELRVKELVSHKAAVLMDIINSGTSLDQKIKQHAHEIDEALLLFLWKRIHTATEHGEGKHVVDALTKLFHRLRLEAERQAASPALRLLDDTLALLADDVAEPDPQERRAAARELLRRTFSGRPADGMDIFGMAAVLAAGEDLPPEEVVGEFVPAQQFAVEVMELLDEARAGLTSLRSELAAVRGRMEEPDVRAAVQQKAAAIAQVEEVLNMARTLQ